MGFSRKLLNENEEIVLDLRPHWFFFLLPIGILTGGLLALIVAGVVSGDNLLQRLVTWAGGAALLVALAWGGWRYLEWVNTNFVVTTDRVIYRSGVFAKRGIQIPLERVNNVLFEQNIIERLLGAGDLLIESAGTEGRQFFENVRQPDKVQNVIYREMEANENRKYGHMGQVAAASLGGGAGADVVSQLERLEGLLQRGTISQAEFDAQKAKLLGTEPGAPLPPPPPPA